ncbi:hypothetical protein HOY82DRAFT_606325 [Tuber indicum]|nr:hypothetical protein HOY82DRAFT_606325 [Tuber indicum]
MSPKRSLLRNVLFYDATKPDEVLGGLVQNGSITEGNFLDIIGIVVITWFPIRVQERVWGHIVSRTDIPLKKGVYDIYCDAPMEVSEEDFVVHLTTHNITGHNERFRREVRDRDRKCFISGLINPEGQIEADIWCDFQAAHIFPLQHESLWNELGYGQWVTDIEDTPGRSKINSSQNGFLLDAAIHTKFDQYLISVNPDDNYKIVVFNLKILGLDGRIPDHVCRNEDDPHRVPDEILRWHFKQSILANVRGP